MKSKVISMLLVVVMLFSSTVTAFATGDPNVDGGGGGMGSGTSIDFWNPGHDGVRVSIVNAETGAVMGTPIDYTNINPSPSYHFGRKSKINYRGGASLTVTASTYQYKNPSPALPQIISSSGSNNITAIRQYFTSEGAATMIAADFGISFETLTSGKYKLLLEPIAYFKFQGQQVAMTAHEAALYDQQLSGGLRSKMASLSHQNLPLAMFLERPDLGFPVYSGGTSSSQSNATILAYLGVGTVTYTELGKDDPPLPAEYDYEYRADTDVITSILVSTSGEINPDSPGQAIFNLPNGTITKEFVIPEDESQLVWVKWRTPNVSETTVYNVPVDVSHGSGGGNLRIKVTPITENTPPDPQGRDRNDGFSLKSPPAEMRVDSLTWGEWWAEWFEFWVWIADLVEVDGSCDTSCDPGCTDSHTETEDQGKWADKGWWIFHWSSYTASLGVTAKTMPDERVPTAVKQPYGDSWEMKSSYGINAEVRVSMTTDGGSGSTSEVQHIIAVFPEFDFETYSLSARNLRS